MDPEIAEAPAGKRQKIMGPRQDEVIERMATWGGPAHHIAGSEHQRSDQRGTAGRQERRPGRRSNRQLVAELTGRVDRAHHDGKQHETRHDQDRPGQGNRKIVIN
jgi:hypothetical protein